MGNRANCRRRFDSATKGLRQLREGNSMKKALFFLLFVLFTIFMRVTPSGAGVVSLVLITGGFTGSSITTSAEIFDSTRGAFFSTGSMNVARELHTATRLQNGMVLIAGGENNGGYLSSAE